MALATLSIDLVAKLARFEGDMGKAARAVEQTQQRIERMAGAIKGAFATIGAGIAVDQIVAFTMRTIDGIDALNDMADATGSTVEKISALEDAAMRTGTQVDTVTTAMVKLNSVLGDAEPGSKQAAMLEAIGLKAEELRKADPADALLSVAKALQQYADDGNKARLVQELFGKSVKEVAPFLKDLAEKGELNAKVTTEQAAQAEAFNKQLASLKTNFDDAARGIVGAMLPAVNNYIERIKKAQEESGYWVETMKFMAKFAASPVWAVTGLFQDQGKGRVSSGKVQDMPDAPRPSVGSLPEPPKSGKSGGSTRSTAEKISEADRYLQNLQRQLETTRDLTVTEKLLDDIQAKRLGEVTAAQQQSLVLTAKRIDEARAAAQAEREHQQVMEEGRRIFDDTRTPLEALSIAQERLNQLLEDGALDWDTYNRAISAANGRFYEATKPAEEATKKLDTFGQRAAKNIQRSLGDTFVDAMNGKFSGIADGFTQMINRMVAEAAAAKLARYLFGDMVQGGTGSGAIGEGLSWLGGVLGFDGGGYTGPGTRSGGLDGKGGFMAMLHPQETVVDHTKGQRMGGGHTQNVYLTVQAPQGGTRDTAMQWGRDAMRGLALASRRNG